MKRLKKEELAYFKKMLLEHRKALAGDVSHLENHALKNPKDNAATLDISNFADLGSDYYEQDFSIGLIENSEETLRAIDDAIQKIDEGTYGVCEGTDEGEKAHRIPKARLKVIPWARYCVGCQRKIEEEEAAEQ